MEILLLRGAKNVGSKLMANEDGSTCVDEQELGEHDKVWKGGAPRVRTGKSENVADVSDVGKIVKQQLSLMNFASEGQIGKSLKAIPEKATAWCNNYLKPVMSQKKTSSHEGDVHEAVKPEQQHEQTHRSDSHEAQRMSSHGQGEHAGENVAASREEERQDGSAQDSNKAETPEVKESAEQLRLRAERQLEETRRSFLLNLDPAAWEKMADEGFFQKAEDDMLAAAKMEKSERGTTRRYADLLHALGALYDRRSYLDETGQRHLQSLQSAEFLRMSIEARQEASHFPDTTAQDESLLAASLVLRAQSLCNYALDGATHPSMSGRQAFDDAEENLRMAIELRAKLKDVTLAEASQAMGYLHYTRGTCILEDPPKEKYTNNPNDTPSSLYNKALEPYFEALAMYVQRDGEDAETTIRMHCNIALVYGQLSRADPCGFIESAEQWYKKAIEEQTRVFGRGHRRTRRLLEDLGVIQQRKSQLQADLDRGRAIITDTVTRRELEMEAKKRKEEGNQLMAEFLAARKQERKQEQQQRYQKGEEEEQVQAQRLPESTPSELFASSRADLSFFGDFNFFNFGFTSTDAHASPRNRCTSPVREREQLAPESEPRHRLPSRVLQQHEPSSAPIFRRDQWTGVKVQDGAETEGFS